MLRYMLERGMSAVKRQSDTSRSNVQGPVRDSEASFGGQLKNGYVISSVKCMTWSLSTQGTDYPEMAQGGRFSRFCVPMERVIDSACDVFLRDRDSFSQRAGRALDSPRSPRNRYSRFRALKRPCRYGSENSCSPSKSINKSTA